jgi:hypothetical protein
MAYMESDSVGALMRSALDDVRELFREEMALARVELRQELSKLTTAGVRFGIAAAAFLFAAAFLLIAVALGVSTLLGWPAWAGFGIVTVVLAIGGLVCLNGGQRALRRLRPLPRTVHTLKENFR